MKIIFLFTGCEDYLFWQQTELKTLKKINELIKESIRTPFVETGKPEPLKHDLSGWWSRRINLAHRLVNRGEHDSLYVLQCRYHY